MTGNLTAQFPALASRERSHPIRVAVPNKGPVDQVSLSNTGAPSGSPSGPPPEVPKNRSEQLQELLKQQPNPAGDHSLLKSAKDKFFSLFVPKNVDSTMTKDYVPTRWWQLAREFMGSVSYGFAAGQASAMALELLIKAQPGVAAATVGLGLGMYWFPKIVEQLRNGTSMATSTVAEVADRRPKAYYLAGDIVDNIGTGILSCAALVPSLYAPITIGVGLLQTGAGVIKGRAGANMGFRQAINPQETLPEINTKQSNQSIALNLVSMVAGAGLQYAVGGTALAVALPIVGCAAAALAVFATSQYLKHLNMENINEAAVRRVVDQLDAGQEIPAPEGKRVWKNLLTLKEKDTIELGQDPTLLKQSGQKRYAQLLDTYKDKKYLLETLQGKPYIVIKKGATKEDSLAAVIQAIQIEKLSQTPEYSKVLNSQGPDAADYWLTSRSLEKVDRQMPGLMARLKDKGWATDLINFLDTDQRFSEEELRQPLPEGQVALP